MKKSCFIFLLLITINHVYSQLPQFQWAKAFHPNNQSNYRVSSNGRSVAVDQAGNVYSAGLFTYSTDFDPGPGSFTLTAANWANTAIYLSKLSASGDFLWAIQIPTYVEFGNIEISIDKNNNIYIASELRLPTDFDPGPGVLTLSPIGGVDAFVAKYDPNGNLIWAKQFGGPGDTVPRSDILTTDNNNNVVVCGSFNSTIDFDPGPAVYNLTATAHIQSFIVKLNSNGQFIWARQFGEASSTYQGSAIRDVKTDAQGNIYLTGDFAGTCDFDPGLGSLLLQSKSTRDGFITKLDGNASLVWAKSIEGTTAFNNQMMIVRGIALDAANNVFVTGDFSGTFDLNTGPASTIITSVKGDWFILKLSNQGEFSWSGVLGGTEIEVGADIDIGSDGSIYAIGSVGPINDMDPGPGVFGLSTTNQYGAAAIVRLNGGGAFISAAAFNQIGNEYGSCITRRMTMNKQDDIFITGSISGTVDFDFGSNVFPLSSNGDLGPYVLKLGRCNNFTSATLTINECNNYTFYNETFDTTGTYIRTIPNSAGCDSIVTIHLTINKKFTQQSKTICEGETIFAGGAFQTRAGFYKDTLRTTLNCDSIITTHLIVNPKPIPNLGPDRDLCTGDKITLDPGTFKQYNWQNGTISDTLLVNTAGTYWVKVVNDFNCAASDTMVIKNLLPLPNGFLKTIDSLCSYDSLFIQPTGLYNQYVWSNGSTDKQLMIFKPGVYSLTVTDANGCKGTNSIGIIQKDCLEGVFIPNAFTPNNDGLNDVFKPIIGGKLNSYRFEIYNRWGELLFSTTEKDKGWNGTFKALPLPPGWFIWRCTYELEGEKPTQRKGQLFLMR